MFDSLSLTYTSATQCGFDHAEMRENNICHLPGIEFAVFGTGYRELSCIVREPYVLHIYSKGRELFVAGMCSKKQQSTRHRETHT